MDRLDNPRDPVEPANETERLRLRKAESSQATANLPSMKRGCRKLKAQKAVADGTYHVSAQEVAEKMIEHMLERNE